MIELLQNKYLIFGIVLFVIVILYNLFSTKNKTENILKGEYNQILNSEKYKVKGQHD